MKRLIKDMGKNSNEEYDRIYYERVKTGQDKHDAKRWARLIRGFNHGDLLDIGCLDSTICDYIMNRPKTTYTGIDIARAAMESQKYKYRNHENVDFLVADLYKMPFQDEAFDYAVMGEVIEHLDDPQAAIEEAMRVLKPGGVLAISTPLEEENEPGAVDHERHVWSFSEDDLKTLLEPYGDVKINITGSDFFPYKYRWPTLYAYCTKK